MILFYTLCFDFSKFDHTNVPKISILFSQNKFSTAAD